MKNVYDIRYEKELSYIFAQRRISDSDKIPYSSIAIILYLYYEDTLEYYFSYIDTIPDNISIYIISSRQEVLDKIENRYLISRFHTMHFMLKENRGRDISALLVTANNTVDKYKYVCFLHDKKKHEPANEEETALWIENLWGNMIGSQSYIQQVIQKFEENDNLGVLAPPDPIGEHFCTWYGYGWHGSFGVTKQLAEFLELKCDLDENKPPITMGTAIWFRVKSLEKLFHKGWKYEYFNDEQLKDPSYLSFGVERIFAYVAQDAGYDTGEIMSLEYAQKQNLLLKDNITKIFKMMQPFFPFPTAANSKSVNSNLDRLLKYVKYVKHIYLYGAGDVGRFCLGFLRKNGINPVSFLVSGNVEEENVDCLPVKSLKDIEFQCDIGVVITVVRKEIQDTMIQSLKKNNCSNYFVFWK